MCDIRVLMLKFQKKGGILKILLNRIYKLTCQRLNTTQKM